MLIHTEPLKEVFEVFLVSADIDVPFQIVVLGFVSDRLSPPDEVEDPHDTFELSPRSPEAAPTKTKGRKCDQFEIFEGNIFLISNFTAPSGSELIPSRSYGTIGW